jgi:hypothetical protein
LLPIRRKIKCTNVRIVAQSVFFDISMIVIGVGGENYYPLNPVEGTNIYNESDLDDPTPPDIDICHCRYCDMFFEPTKAEM